MSLDACVKLTKGHWAATIVLSSCVAFACGTVLVIYLPLDPANAIFVGGLATPIVWIGAMVAGFLARSFRTVLMRLGLVLLLALVLVGAAAFDGS